MRCNHHVHAVMNHCLVQRLCNAWGVCQACYTPSQPHPTLCLPTTNPFFSSGAACCRQSSGNYDDIRIQEKGSWGFKGIWPTGAPGMHACAGVRYRVRFCAHWNTARLPPEAALSVLLPTNPRP